MDGFARHIAACNNLASPAGYLPFRIGAEQVGWLEPDLARWLAYRPRDFHFDAEGVSLPARLRSRAARESILADAAMGLEKAGYLKLRDELFDVRATTDGPVLATLDRGAIPAFGVIAQGVHLNGLVRRADGLHLWLGKRSRAKSVAPGQWDNIVAGGAPAGLTMEETLVKEASEEAGLAPELTARARRVSALSYVMKTAEGMRRDTLHVFDLDLPEDVEPVPHDDEVERFELWPIARVLELVRDSDQVKFNVNLVLIDLFLREGLIDAASQEGRVMAAALRA
ncbi:NUDIX hydrolase [Roseomonas sp. USHLN139]|uniref:NUDIX hydrolase n=1 Tax=Roseomonas sp. USHLN139 TaxID=3081298 RepID=UPI003B0133D5